MRLRRLNRPRIIAVVSAMVLVLGGIGFDLFIVVHGVDRARLGRLAAVAAPAGFTAAPARSQQVAANQGLPAVSAAARSDAAATGVYAVEWTSKASSRDSASLVVSLLPDASAAATAQGQAIGRYLARTSYSAEKYSYVGAVGIPGVSGARASLFHTTGGPPLVTVSFREGRAEVLELVGRVGTDAAAETAAVSLARSEDAHLRAVLPGFSLGATEVPAVAASVYWLVLVTVVGLIVAGPLAVSRARARREALRLQAARRLTHGRGHKVVRRQAAPRR